jgi:hypothetical protein
MYYLRIQVRYIGRIISGQNEVPRLYVKGSDKIQFQSRIGTKLIIGFLVIASITGLVGYFSLNYSQTVGNNFTYSCYIRYQPLIP